MQVEDRINNEGFQYISYCLQFITILKVSGGKVFITIGFVKACIVFNSVRFFSLSLCHFALGRHCGLLLIHIKLTKGTFLTIKWLVGLQLNEILCVGNYSNISISLGSFIQKFTLLNNCKTSRSRQLLLFLFLNRFH